MVAPPNGNAGKTGATDSPPGEVAPCSYIQMAPPLILSSLLGWPAHMRISVSLMPMSADLPLSAMSCCSTAHADKTKAKARGVMTQRGNGPPEWQRLAPDPRTP